MGFRIFPEILPVIAQVLPVRAKVGAVPRKILLVGVNIGLVASDVASILRDIPSLSTGVFRRLIVRGSCACLRIFLRRGGSRSRVILTATLVPPVVVQILPIRAKISPVPRQILLVGVDIGLLAGDVAPILLDIPMTRVYRYKVPRCGAGDACGALIFL